MKFELNKLYHMDCLTAMKNIPDKFFELAIVDPPYGNDSDKNELGCHFHERGRGAKYKIERSGGGKRGRKYGDKINHWDIAPPQKYFDELFRVSKNQIIFGGNYFALPPTRCFIVWDKLQPENFSMAMAEYAWASFNANAKIFRCLCYGEAGNTKGESRFHPTQKPIKLYSWLLGKYAKKGDKILDTHVGSASSLIACHKAGFEFLGFELDEHYFKCATERLERHKYQTSFFDQCATGG
ncbi:MAG: site-specific DNA-methyltransferase [Firmicutes bacterium]|nr:site-specific DNA-methyltransferase [Bacillota bacterium]